MSNIKILNCNAYDYLPKIKTNSVDLILTDPPYNISKYSTGNIIFNNRKNINNDIAKWDNVEINIEELSKQFTRILKPTGNMFIFTGYNNLGKWHYYLDPLFDTFQIMIWHKINPTPKFYKNGFLNSCEIIICLWNKYHTWNFTSQDDMHNFIETNICSYPERISKPFHPTQKPIKVLNKIISVASNENDIVFDPFMGVGSTGIACMQLNRKFLGIEIDRNYYNATISRLKDVKRY